MFTADAHADTLYQLAIHGASPASLMVTRDRLAMGQVGLATFALFSGTATDSGTPVTRADKMLQMVDRLGVPVIAGRLPSEPPAEPRGILSIEGGEVLEGSLDRLHQMHARGIKMIALTWNYENEIGYPANGDTKKGLKPFGRELLAEMDRLGILCDVSHLNDAGIDDVLALSKLPVVASHSNARDLAGVKRNLARAQIEGIIEKRGFIGINFYPKFLAVDRAATGEDILRHMAYFLEMGAQECLGFGSDFDGIEIWPDGFGGPESFPTVLAMLRARGASGDTLQDIAGRNLWRVLKAAER